MIFTSDFKNGARLEIDGEPFVIVEFQHVKPGKGGAFVRTKLKSLKSGNVLERTYRSGEKFPTPNLEEKDMQFLYLDGESYHFMDTKNYEQVSIQKENMGDVTNLLKENMTARIIFFNGKAISVELPIFVELKIVQTDPGVKGDTATGGTKPAILETGATIKVPFHINEGDYIKIDTRTREYVERVK